MIALSENIRRLRRIRGLSQEELANRLNVSRQSVSLWEQGVTNPTVENIYAMAEVLEASFDELLAPPPSVHTTGTAPAARSFDELLRTEPPRDTAKSVASTASAPPDEPCEPAVTERSEPCPPTEGRASSFSNAPVAASIPVGDGWDGQTVTPQVMAEARYYRYRRLKGHLTVSMIVLLCGVCLFVLAFVVAAFASENTNSWLDDLGAILVLASMPIMAGGLIATIIHSVRAAAFRRKMGDLFDLATYEDLKRGGGNYATRRKP